MDSDSIAGERMIMLLLTLVRLSVYERGPVSAVAFSMC